MRTAKGAEAVYRQVAEANHILWGMDLRHLNGPSNNEARLAVLQARVAVLRAKQCIADATWGVEMGA